MGCSISGRLGEVESTSSGPVERTQFRLYVIPRWRLPQMLA